MTIWQRSYCWARAGVGSKCSSILVSVSRKLELSGGGGRGGVAGRFEYNGTIWNYS